MDKKLCWVITGAGHFLRECAEMIERVGDAADVHLTRAAVEVCGRYRVTDRIRGCGAGTFREGGFSAPGIVKFAKGEYCALVVAPATSNTVAKCALGIADSLASTFFSQSNKGDIPTIFLPTDAAPEMTSVTPSGKEITIRPRAIDLAHVRTLASFPNVRVAASPDELEEMLEPFLRSIRD